ncbi:MAG TPA: TonB-dependent receptor [Burkholderiales bacterium]
MAFCARLTPRARLALTIALAFSAGATFAAERADLEAPTVEVIGTTPVPGLGAPINEVPANAAVHLGTEMQRKQAINLPDFMIQSLPSVSISEVQNNPFQPNVNYRGFQSSPLLGAPQGLSVFQDGVRINEPFGDVVNWDLIPQNAISSMTLVPGSNPVFGLNTLGGAIEIQTKSGTTHPGFDAQVYGGSFGRKAVELSGGGYGENVDFFIAGTWFDEDGWRDFSPTEVRQIFAKVGWQNADTDFDLSITHAETDLTGNGVLPLSMLEQRRDQIYTYPDNTQNDLTMVTLNGSHWMSDEWLLSGLTYVRKNTTKTLNGDVNDDYDFLGGVDEQGVLNRSRNEQEGYGFGLQASWVLDRNTLAVGATYDHSESDFVQTEQEGDEFNDDRSVGDLEDEELNTSLLGKTQTTSLYFTDTYKVTDKLAATLSGRYNRTIVKATDRINPPGSPQSLDADYTYTKFNPAVGFTYQVTPSLNTYAGWNQGSRAPTPIELGCANPDEPCALPNAMASDPFLNQVVTQTLELGVRGALSNSLFWNAGLFRSINKDDILFVAEGTGSRGYFTNFGRTRREGAELGISSDRGNRFAWSAGYSYVKATFESEACVVSESNSTAGTVCPGDGILVTPGNSIPGIPEHQFKVSGDFRVTDNWSIGGTVLSYSDQYVHGNENNQHDENGKVDGYSILNLTTSYRLGQQWEIFARINNVFDENYSTGGILAENSFGPDGAFVADDGNWEDETFYAPGAPRAAWIGIRYSLSKQPKR